MTGRRGRKGTGPADVERTGDHVTPVTTVVGGQTRRPSHGTTRVPIGIEKVLYLAAADEPFRRRLLEDRPRALAASRVQLTDVERATLLGVPRTALESMISRISPARHGKRSFMKTVAAATVSLAAGVAAPGCTEEGPDRTPDVSDAADTTEAADTADVEYPDGSRGISADVPDEVDLDAAPDYAPGGVMPDADIDAGWEPEAD